MTTKSYLLGEIFIAIFNTHITLTRVCDSLVASHGINTACWQLLWIMAEHQQPITVPHMAVRVGVTRQAVQKQVHALLKEQLIISLTNPSNKRSPCYTLSAQGEKLYQHIHATIFLPWIGKMVESYNEQELHITLAKINRLATLLPQYLPLNTDKDDAYDSPF